jgi:uncharacterized membrane protein YfcA
MMPVTLLAMLRERSARTTQPTRSAWGRVAAAGVAIGALTGLVVAGGGFIIVPALALLCGLDISTATGTSVLVIAANSFAGFAAYVGYVPIDAHVAGIVTVAAVAGSVVGAHLAGRVRPAALRSTFGAFVLGMAVLVLGKQSRSWGVTGVAAAVAITGVPVVRRRPAVRKARLVRSHATL